jgi:hypothetical protein
VAHATLKAFANSFGADVVTIFVPRVAKPTRGWNFRTPLEFDLKTSHVRVFVQR